MLQFHERLTFAQRHDECQRVKKRRPDYIPTIMVQGDNMCPRIDKEKFLLPLDLTGGQISYVIRRRLKMSSADALFLVCGGRLIPSNESVKMLYQQYMSDDGFLYITYTLENAFG